MKNMKICKCGICEDDCDYHKPVIEEKHGEVLTWDNNFTNWTVVPVTPNQTYTITIGSGGWKAPDGVTHVILTGCGGGGGGGSK